MAEDFHSDRKSYLSSVFWRSTCVTLNTIISLIYSLVTNHWFAVLNKYYRNFSWKIMPLLCFYFCIKTAIFRLSKIKTANKKPLYILERNKTWQNSPLIKETIKIKMTRLPSSWLSYVVSPMPSLKIINFVFWILQTFSGKYWQARHSHRSPLPPAPPKQDGDI